MIVLYNIQCIRKVLTPDVPASQKHITDLALRTLQVYSEACQVLSAVADHLNSSSANKFMFGAQPSSLDAFLLGHLLFYRSSLAAVPVLRDMVSLLIRTPDVSLVP